MGLASRFARLQYVRKKVLNEVQNSFSQYGQLDIGDLLFEMRAEHDIKEEETWEALISLRLVEPSYKYEDYVRTFYG